MRSRSPLLVALSLISIAAAPASAGWFESIYISPYQLKVTDVVAAPERGVFVVGHLDSGKANSFALSVRYDGIVAWQKAIQESDPVPLRLDQAVATTDGGMIVVVRSRSASDAPRWALVKLRPEAQSQWGVAWTNAFDGGPEVISSEVTDLIQVADGGFVLLAWNLERSGPGGLQYSYVHVIKTDSAGNPVWSARHGHRSVDHIPTGMVENPANGDLFAFFASHNGKAWLLHLDSAGTVLNQRYYPLTGSFDLGQGPNYNQGPASIALVDGSSVIVEGSDAIARLDVDGTVKWKQSFVDSETGKPLQITGVSNAGPGSFAVSGVHLDGPEFAWVARMDADGKVSMARRYDIDKPLSRIGGIVTLPKPENPRASGFVWWGTPNWIGLHEVNLIQVDSQLRVNPKGCHFERDLAMTVVPHAADSQVARLDGGSVDLEQDTRAVSFEEFPVYAIQIHCSTFPTCPSNEPPTIGQIPAGGRVRADLAGVYTDDVEPMKEEWRFETHAFAGSRNGPVKHVRFSRDSNPNEDDFYNVSPDLLLLDESWSSGEIPPELVIIQWGWSNDTGGKYVFDRPKKWWRNDDDDYLRAMIKVDLTAIPDGTT